MKLWRVVGFDDSFKGDLAYIVGCVTCKDYVEGFLIDRIEVDGWDVSEKIVELISNSKFYKQIRCVLLSGITFAGFNIADLEFIHERLGIPVVVVLEKYPNFEKIEKALRNLEEFEKRIELVKKAGKVRKVGRVLVQLKGCDLEFAEKILKLTTRKGKTPEPLRIAHLVASALIHGESRRR
ncbi:endonuclease dU [Archaeoglobus sp.]